MNNSAMSRISFMNNIARKVAMLRAACAILKSLKR